MSNSADVRTSEAISRGAVTAADILALTSPQGAPLPLDNGDNQVVVVYPVQCCSHAGMRAERGVPDVHEVPRAAPLFEMSEHVVTVYGLTLKTESGLVPAHSARLTLGPGLQLTYGQVIALGGDFYGDPDHPVCLAGDSNEQIAQFELNFRTLAASPDEVRKILDIAQRFEFNPLAEAVRQGHVPSGVFVDNSRKKQGSMSQEDAAFDMATGGTGNPLSPGRYLRLAFTNFDHFGPDAIACYLAGHTLAQTYARKARAAADPQARKQGLEMAYAVNAFADHFLTDLFAAGHMRTPRRWLFDIAATYLTQGFAGLLAKRMHDEDNKFGLWVGNDLGDRWVAYGDARYRDRWNAANRKVMKSALQRSMDEIWEAFDQGRLVGQGSQVLGYLPRVIQELGQGPTASSHRADPQNWSPLFWRNPDDDNVWRRNELLDPANRSFGEYSAINPCKWGITTTFIQLMAADGPWMPDAEYQRAQLPLHPDEAGASGEFGWPAQPSGIIGHQRVFGATGPNLDTFRPEDWVVDGSPEPSGMVG